MLLEAPDILVDPTCVRVPVFYGHSEAVHIETRDKLSAADARALLSKAPGVQVLDERRRTVAIRLRSSMPQERIRCGSVGYAKTSHIRAARSLNRPRRCSVEEKCLEQCTNRGAFAKRTAISVTYCTL